LGKHSNYPVQTSERALHGRSRGTERKRRLEGAVRIEEKNLGSISVEKKNGSAWLTGKEGADVKATGRNGLHVEKRDLTKFETTDTEKETTKLCEETLHKGKSRAAGVSEE